MKETWARWVVSNEESKRRQRLVGMGAYDWQRAGEWWAQAETLSPNTSLDWWSQLTAVWMWNQTHDVVLCRESGERANNPSLLGPKFIWADIDWVAAAQQMIGKVKPSAGTDRSLNALSWRDKSHSQQRERQKVSEEQRETSGIKTTKPVWEIEKTSRDEFQQSDTEPPAYQSSGTSCSLFARCVCLRAAVGWRSGRRSSRSGWCAGSRPATSDYSRK